MKPQLLNYIEALVSNKCSGASMCRRILKDTTCPLIKITAKCVMIADTILAKGRGTTESSAKEANWGWKPWGEAFLQIAVKSLEISKRQRES